MKQLSTLLTITLSLILFLGCDKEETIKSISLDETSLSLEVNDTHSFKVIITPSNLEAPAYSWKTSDEDVVSVNNRGEIKAISLGEATITVYNVGNTLQSSCKVSVKPTKATGITLNKKILDLIIDEEYILKYEISPEKTTNKEVSWSSADTDVATVDSEGKVKAIKVGETTITIFNHDKTLNVSCKVNVKPIKTTGISLDVETLDLLVDEEYTLKYKISPDNSTNKEVTWSSADTDVAIVDSEGKVKAIGVGKTTISIFNHDKTIETICKVNVKPIKATGISLNIKKLDLFVGEDAVLKHEIIPENTTNKEVTWTSANTNIATVSSEGKVEGISAGETIVTVKVNGSIFDTCIIKISNVKATRISLSETSITMKMTDKFSLTVNFTPKNTTNKNITWSSSNSNIASVTNSGLITALKEGTVVITAESEDGNLTAHCNVIVRPVIYISPNRMELLISKTKQIWVNDLNGDPYFNATWKSSNADVVTVNAGENGQSAIVEAVSKGTTKITATSVDGSVTVECFVEVKDIKDFITLEFFWFNVTTIQGFVTGDVYSLITNNSPESIEIIEWYIFDGYTDQQKAWNNSSPELIGPLPSGAKNNWGMKLNSVYKPIYMWVFKWNGDIYEVKHQYEGGSGSFLDPLKNVNMKLNLIAE